MASNPDNNVLRTMASPSETRMSESVKSEPERKTRILLVEDHAPTRVAMRQLIQESGADVVTARDGEEAMGYLLTQLFDVLLTDLRMPVMDGFELVEHCMKLPESRRPKRVIAISGEYEAGVLRQHPVGFLRKPFDLQALLNMLEGRLN